MKDQLRKKGAMGGGSETSASSLPVGVLSRMRAENVSGRSERRDRLRIYSEIIRLIADEISRSGGAKITRVQVRSNVPYVRFKDYLNGLVALKLVVGGDSIRLTEKGEEFAREYYKIVEFYRRMGFME